MTVAGDSDSDDSNLNAIAMITDLMKFWGRSEAWVLNYYRKPEEKT